MTTREPEEEEINEAETDVEGHGVDEEDEGEVGILDANGICA